MYKLLFVDDDANLLKINRVYFGSRGYQVFTATSAQRAKEYLESQAFDCVILDILMPGPNGYALCRSIKSQTDVPVIFLTSLTEKDFLYRGFDLGADDYVTKPYELRELEARVRARINQNLRLGRPEKLLDFSPLTIDADGRRAAVNGKPLALTAYEFDILLLLARSPGRVFSLEEIYREVWRMPDLQNAQTVRVHLARMRHKLEAACPERCYIELVWGKGFRFQKNQEKSPSD